ncbi:hypothetical protein PV325_008762, partial [Microctonus aethiopoides]
IQSVSDISGKKYNDDDTNSSDDEDKNKCVIGTFETKKLSAQRREFGGTSDPIKGEHSAEIWESEKSSPSTIKRTNQQVTASCPLYPLMNQSAPRRSRRGKIKGRTFRFRPKGRVKTGTS